MATFRFDGHEYPDFDASFKSVTMPEWRQIKQKTGYTLRQFLEGVGDVDPDALTCLRWLVLRSDRQHDALVLNLDAGYSAIGFAEAWKTYQEDEAAEAAADPTLAGSLPAGPTPELNGSTTPTLTNSSPTTTQGLPGGAA